MDNDGTWIDHYDLDDKTRTITGSVLNLHPVFHGEVSLQGDGSWRPTLNGEALGGYPNIDAAKARVGWEIVNRVRHFRPAYLRLLERKDEWEKGGGALPPLAPEAEGFVAIPVVKQK